MLAPNRENSFAEWQRRAQILQAAHSNKSIQKGIMALSKRDPVWWISTFCWTYDPRREVATIPFVLYEFQEEIPKLWLGEPGYVRADGKLWPMLFDKSRDMGITWVIAASICYGLIFKEVTYGMMTRNGQELDSHTPQSLFGKLDFLFKNLPAWMVDHNAIKAGRKRNPHQFAYRRSSVEGSLTTEDAFRQQRHTRTFVDEAPVIPKLDALLTSIQDVTPAPCLVGTPKGKNAFYHMISGRDFKVIPHHIEMDEANKARFGWLHRRYHYSSHPHKTPGTKVGDAWFERERAQRSEFAWAQEQEISYDQTAEGRIWPAFTREHVYEKIQWDHLQNKVLAHSEIVAAWDFGTSHKNPTCCMVAAICKQRGRPTKVYILDYRSWKRQHADTVAREYFKYLGRWGVKKHYGDVSGINLDSTLKSWIDNLSDRGIHIQGTTTQRKGRQIRDTILHLIEHDRLWVAAPATVCDKGHQGPAVDDVLFQYRVGSNGKPEKDEFSHLADCLCYIVLKEIMNTRGITSERL